MAGCPARAFIGDEQRHVTITWESAAGSHSGRVRRVNEDAFRIDEDAGIFILADGMGGHAAGEVASRLAADAALEALARSRSTENPDLLLNAAFAEARRRIVERCDHDPATAGMGTTLTAAFLSPSGKLHIGHIGDSRLYHFDGNVLRPLTRDHTLIQQELDAGRVKPEEASKHRLSHILTRVLTAEDPSDPDLIETRVQAGDLLLLCSDGLYNMLDGHELVQLLADGDPLPLLIDRMIGAANDKGGLDNITALVVRVLAR